MHGSLGRLVPERLNMAQVRCAGRAGCVSLQAALESVAQLPAHVCGRCAPCKYPREMEFVAELPMTTTGKVRRRVLRRQEAARAKARAKARAGA